MVTKTPDFIIERFSSDKKSSEGKKEISHKAPKASSFEMPLFDLLAQNHIHKSQKDAIKVEVYRLIDETEISVTKAAIQD